MIQMSPRLDAIVELIDSCHSLADVGCDHGYVLVNALEKSKIKKAIAIDISSPSLKKSQDILEAKFHKDQFKCVKGDGLKAVSTEHIDSCVIAGMGGILISSIIENSISKIKGFDFLILQPMQAEEELFSYLTDNGFILLDKSLIREIDKYYPILKVKYSGQKKNISWLDFKDEKEFKNLCLKKIQMYKDIEVKILNHSEDKKDAREIEKLLIKWEDYFEKSK